MTDYTEAPLPSRRAIRFDPTRGRAHVYDDARRHSRAVGWLKLALPAIAAASVLGFILTTILGQDDGTGSIVSLSGVNVEDKSLVMKSPHISGFAETHKEYEVTAVRAVQQLDNPKVVRLDDIIAHFGMGGGDTATVNAKTGVYDGNKRTMHLSKGIVLDTTNGYHATLDEAQIDVTKGELFSKSEVHVKASNGTIHSHAIEIHNRGARVIFGDGVSVTYYPPEKDNETEKEGTAPAADKPAAADKPTTADATPAPAKKKPEASTASAR